MRAEEVRCTFHWSFVSRERKGKDFDRSPSRSEACRRRIWGVFRFLGGDVSILLYPAIEMTEVEGEIWFVHNRRSDISYFPFLSLVINLQVISLIFYSFHWHFWLELPIRFCFIIYLVGITSKNKSLSQVDLFWSFYLLWESDTILCFSCFEKYFDFIYSFMLSTENLQQYSMSFLEFI